MTKVHGLVLLGGLLLAGSVCGQTTEDTPAAREYAHLTTYRERAEAILKDGHDSAAARAQAEAVLKDGLAAAEAPLPRALAQGDLYLRFRPYNIRADLFSLYVAEGEKAKALDIMAQMIAQTDAVNAYGSPETKALLKDEPRYRQMLAIVDANGRRWHAQSIASAYGPQLDVAQRIAGLSLFWSEAKYGFAHFDHVPDLDWDKAYQAFLPQVIAASDTAAYYEVMMRFAPLLHDGHTNIYPPDALKAHFYARPALGTALVEGKVLVTAVDSPAMAKTGLHVGDEITAIDGVEVHRYAHEHVEPYESSSTPQDLDVRLYTYGLLAGDHATPLSLTVSDARRHVRQVTVSRESDPHRHAYASFAYRLLPGGVAYVAINDFESDVVVKAFEQHLPEIMRAKGLVLDLRSNGGGSDSYGFQILSHLTDQPIPSARSTQLMVSPASRANGGMPEWQELSGSAQTYQPDAKPVYRGPVALLTSAQTFSAAEDFVMSFDALRRGPLIGQATGGSTGMPLSFDLPGGGSARICVKRDSYPDGREFVGTGIAPTVAVASSVDDIRAGRDPVLDRARRVLLGN